MKMKKLRRHENSQRRKKLQQLDQDYREDRRFRDNSQASIQEQQILEASRTYFRN
jgi:hypothetical protein